MDEGQAYLFDINGFLCVQDAISPSALGELRNIMDRRIAEETEPTDNHIRFPRWRTAENGGGWSTVPQHITDQHNMIHWGKAVRDLLVAEPIYSIMADLCGASFRLDHIYAQVHHPGSPGGGLHEIGIDGGGMYAYHARNGRFQNGMTVVAFELEDIHPGDGGLGVVPGS